LSSEGCKLLNPKASDPKRFDKGNEKIAEFDLKTLQYLLSENISIH